jgi:hypothetical protein
LECIAICDVREPKEPRIFCARWKAGRRYAMTREERSTHYDLHLEKVRALLDELKYGSITIYVQDGRIVQIDRTEKHRIKD